MCLCLKLLFGVFFSPLQTSQKQKIPLLVFWNIPLILFYRKAPLLMFGCLYNQVLKCHIVFPAWKILVTLLDDQQYRTINAKPDRQEQKLFGGFQEGWTVAKTIQGMCENYLKLVSILLGKNIGCATPHLNTRGWERLQQEKSRVWFSLRWWYNYVPATRYSSNLLCVGQIKPYSIPSENKWKVRWQYKVEANSVYKQSKLWQEEKTWFNTALVNRKTCWLYENGIRNAAWV